MPAKRGEKYLADGFALAVKRGIIQYRHADNTYPGGYEPTNRFSDHFYHFLIGKPAMGGIEAAICESVLAVAPDLSDEDATKAAVFVFQHWHLKGCASGQGAAASASD